MRRVRRPHLASFARIAGVGAALAFVAGTPARARASGSPSEADIRAARDLFVHAVEDEDGGRWEAALEKLYRVLAVKDTPGVRYHVALCEERLGKLATAWAEYTVADEKARSEQAHDVLRLTSKKLAELSRRVPHLTVRVTPPEADATLTIDGRPAPVGDRTPVDPGSHQVEVLPVEGRAPTTVAVSVGEGESRTLDVELRPVVAQELPPVAAAAPPSRAEASPPAAPPPARSEALLETVAAATLAAGGVAAFAVSGAARDQASRDCAQVSSPDPQACDPYRVPVRVWDWVAVGAWTGAGVMATLAIVSWARRPEGQSRVVVGPGSVRVEGSF
jgi:hypothetical protein